MATATCNSCNVRFVDDEQKRLHYRSEWHRYNLKRKVAGVPGVTEALYLAWQAATALLEGSNNLTSTPDMFGCAMCGKEYRSSRDRAQHLISRSHRLRASQEPNSSIAEITTAVKPLSTHRDTSAEDDEEEEECMEELGDKCTSNICMQVDEDSSKCDEEPEELDPSSCFMCDFKHDSVDDCMAHMHKKHGFFIPDSEYLKDATGLLTYVGLKVKRDFICIYCDDRRQPFHSLEAVRKHIDAKGHCKLQYGDGGDDEDADLEDFYDYSSSYIDVEGRQLINADDANSNIELGIGGSELVITTNGDKGTRVRSLGSRKFTRYYRQKPRPSAVTVRAPALSMPSRHMLCGNNP